MWLTVYTGVTVIPGIKSEIEVYVDSRSTEGQVLNALHTGCEIGHRGGEELLKLFLSPFHHIVCYKVFLSTKYIYTPYV